jgi:hypothetical protein
MGKGEVFEGIWNEIKHVRRVEKKNQKIYILIGYRYK